MSISHQVQRNYFKSKSIRGRESDLKKWNGGKILEQRSKDLHRHSSHQNNLTGENNIYRKQSFQVFGIVLKIYRDWRIIYSRKFTESWGKTRESLWHLGHSFPFISLCCKSSTPNVYHQEEDRGSLSCQLPACAYGFTPEGAGCWPFSFSTSSIL